MSLSDRKGIDMSNKVGIEIDTEALSKWIAGTWKTKVELAAEIGRGDGYISRVIKEGKMPKTTYDFMCKTFNLPAGTFIPKPPAPPKPEKPKTVIPPASAETGWQTRIKVAPDKVHFMVYFNGMEVVTGSSWIKEPRKELQLMQAISYAAHIAYKLMEQKVLQGRATK